MSEGIAVNIQYVMKANRRGGIAEFPLRFFISVERKSKGFVRNKWMENLKVRSKILKQYLNENTVIFEWAFIDMLTYIW